ncbi:hypothetical protein T4B_9597 [Trichinella pseudospiralis]|uniref:Uncharacterized protein n=1 Tax=Trichinella pseudospiralis TaxID=6337 RepID=A0A0V1JB83_TRIPS|nr:hypothetical protein T4B_9597 [Trichinella pseudospiralis]KRZ38979.1 hypothetical protein T4C_5734 [Trichinella pseudospiralis]
MTSSMEKKMRLRRGSNPGHLENISLDKQTVNPFAALQSPLEKYKVFDLSKSNSYDGCKTVQNAFCYTFNELDFLQD